MAKIRTIKPEFWTDQKLSRVSMGQRLFYIGLWNQADDDGRFRAIPRMLLGTIFPFDQELDEEFVSIALDMLADMQRITLYEVDGEKYGQICKWHDHQVISRPAKSRIPPPPNDLGTSAVKLHVADSEMHCNDNVSHCPEVEMEMEMEMELGDSVSEKKKDVVMAMWDVWKDELGQGMSVRLTDHRKQKLGALYDEHLKGSGNPVDAFRSVLGAVKRSSHHMENIAYQTPESLFRNEERRERWANSALPRAAPEAGLVEGFV